MTVPAVVLAILPDWELAERARLEANRCPNPDCRALLPNHRPGCELQRLPDPDAERCLRCEYPLGSLGCRLAHGRHV